MEKTKDIFGFIEEAKKTGASDEEIYSKVSFYLEQKARETSTPFRGSFELTPLCNLNCKMCYVHLKEAQMRDRKLLPAEMWIDLMNQAIRAGMTRATLTGGECLIYPKFNELYLFLQSKGIMVTVKTNGILLDSDRINFFKKYPPRGIHISLYGHSDEIYEKVTGNRVFSIVLENIQKAKKARLPISIMITPNSYIGEAVKETIRFAKELELPYFINSFLMTPRSDTQKDKEKYDISLEQCVDILLYNASLNNVILQAQEPKYREMRDESNYELKGVRCGAGKSSFSIRWDGSMHPCTLMDSISDNPIEIGFDSAWRHINQAVNFFPTFKKCEKCSYSQICTFCAAENEKMGSKFLLNNIWCQRTWKMAEYGLASLSQRCEEHK